MIKASYEVLQPASGRSFIFRKFGKVAFDAPYHFHPEYELTYIINGEGKRYVGSHMADFSAGDLVLLGSNLPHCWKLEDTDKSFASGEAIVIQFTSDFLGNDFFSRSEMQHIQKLLEKSASGICFKGATREIVNTRLMQLTEERSNFRMLVSLLEILQQLATTGEYSTLDQQRNLAEKSVTEQERVNPVFAYLVENFRNQVTLEEAASIANMTPNAFCKYFKKATRKTFMETVIEYRLNYATQQLVQTDKPISEISFDSGFGDVSHFYKMFKSKMQVSPLNYRKRFMSDLQSERKEILV
jgi:AraC-like DNA-binding protein